MPRRPTQGDDRALRAYYSIGFADQELRTDNESYANQVPEEEGTLQQVELTASGADLYWVVRSDFDGPSWVVTSPKRGGVARVVAESWNGLVLQVDEEGVTVGQMMDYLRRRLTLEDRPIQLKQLLRNIDSRQTLVCMFLALLEMVRLQAIQLRQERLFGEILLRKHPGFEAIMAEQAVLKDEWR